MKLPPVAEWLLMKQPDVLHKFMGIKGAFTEGRDQKRFVYIPGGRDDRALLVAHSDTVWGDVDIELGYSNDTLYSKQRNKSVETKNRYGCGTSTRFGIGIGADDRVGCSILWHLKDLGHSLLITSGEESGCQASEHIMTSEWWRKEINTTHVFAVQFDRRGCNDAVFYNLATTDFAEYVKDKTGYKPSSGCGTDIRRLCTLICGVNLSSGYYSEHSSEERLIVSQYLNTLAVAKQWLKGPLSHFPLDKDHLYEIPVVKPRWEEEWDERQAWKQHNNYVNTHSNTSPVIDDVTLMVDETEDVICPICKGKMTVHQWFENTFKCVHCNNIL